MTANYLDRLPSALKRTGDHTQGEIELLSPQDKSDFGVLYEDSYILLIRDRVLFPTGDEGAYIRVINASELTGGAGTVMIPLWNRDIAFIRIFRHATRTWEWELPRGYLEPGLSEEANAIKEIQEELGVAPCSVRRIGKVNPNSGLLTSQIGVCVVELAADPSISGRPQASEGVAALQLVPMHQLHDFVASAGVRCGISLAALFLYLHQDRKALELRL